MTPDPTHDSQLLKGVLPMVALALLETRESYGYELVTRMREAGLESIAPGTVYPVLSRLERDGHVESFLVPSPSGPARKYYRPTPQGREHRRQARAAWNALADLVGTIMTEEDER